ncbi:hypothetical protein EV182_001233 [Spiromyces aspiralis]|uniref:Uncharacterized protein n=1 Tax=Spiromyces aspiralis TaxID=68401 RepID=A0ACC1HU46_9FUNG|nr:hypothetical protein EV182_001233 [Spiromyces aspiralis]
MVALRAPHLEWFANNIKQFMWIVFFGATILDIDINIYLIASAELADSEEERKNPPIKEDDLKKIERVADELQTKGNDQRQLVEEMTRDLEKEVAKQTEEHQNIRDLAVAVKGTGEQMKDATDTIEPNKSSKKKWIWITLAIMVGVGVGLGLVFGIPSFNKQSESSQNNNSNSGNNHSSDVSTQHSS